MHFIEKQADFRLLKLEKGTSDKVIFCDSRGLKNRFLFIFQSAKFTIHSTFYNVRLNLIKLIEKMLTSTILVKLWLDIETCGQNWDLFQCDSQFPVNKFSKVLKVSVKYYIYVIIFRCKYDLKLKNQHQIFNDIFNILQSYFSWSVSETPDCPGPTDEQLKCP